VSSPVSTASPRQLGKQRQADFVARLAPRLRDVVKEVTEIDRQITKLKNRRQLLSVERDRIKRLMYDPPSFERRSGNGQGLFVHTKHILPYIERWIEDYDALHGRGGQIALARRANVSAKNIRSYKNGTIAYAGILSVDRIFTAMERTDLLDDLPFKTALELKIGSHRKAPEPPPSKYYEE
jgi:hypothetical protein